MDCAEDVEVKKDQNMAGNSPKDKPKPNQSQGNKDTICLAGHRTDINEHNMESSSINKPEQDKFTRDTGNHDTGLQLNQKMPQKDPHYLSSNPDGKSKSQNQQDAGGSIMNIKREQSKTSKKTENSATGTLLQKTAQKHLDNFGSSRDSNKPKSTDQKDAANTFIDIKLEQSQTSKDLNSSSSGTQRQKTNSHKSSDNLSSSSDRKPRKTKQNNAETCFVNIKLNQTKISEITEKCATGISKQNRAKRTSKVKTSEKRQIHNDKKSSSEDDHDSDTDSGSHTDSSSEDSLEESKYEGGLRGLRFSDKLALMFRVCEDNKESKTALKEKSKVCKKRASSPSDDDKTDKVLQFAATKGTVKKQKFIDASGSCDKKVAQIKTVSKEHSSNKNLKDNLRTSSEDLKSSGDITLKLDKISNKSQSLPTKSKDAQKDLDNQSAEEREVHSSDTEIYEYEDCHEADSVSSFSPDADEGNVDTDSSFTAGLEDAKDEKEGIIKSYTLRQRSIVHKYKAISSSDDETDKVKFASKKRKVKKPKFEDTNEGIKSVSKKSGGKTASDAVKSKTKEKRIRKRHQYPKLVCTVCGKELEFYYARKHMKLHEGKLNHVCDICGKAYALPGSLKKHLKYHTKLENHRSAPCSICGERFATNRYMRYHEYFAHKEKFPDVDIKDIPKIMPRKKLDSKNHICSYCDRRYMFGWQLKAHVSSHHTGNITHRCSTCDKTFENAGNLKRHQRTHRIDNQPFSCSFCPARFTQDSSRKAHEKRHTGERPHSCAFCTKTFIQKSNKTTHEKRCKMRPGGSRSARFEKNSVAVSPVTSKSGVAGADQQTHQADKHVFRCSFCPAQFVQDSSRKAHEIGHMGERPTFSCDFCMETFTQKCDKITHEEKCKVKFKGIPSAKFEEERAAVLPIMFTPGVPDSLPRLPHFTEFF